MFVAFDPERHIPDDHPLRPVERWCDRLLAGMNRDFDRAYDVCSRRGIPPESLVKCLLLRALFGIPSERRLCEACEYNLLHRWFIDRPFDEPMWNPETFSMNRDRFELHDLVRKFFDRLVAEGIVEGLIGDDRFSVDGRLIRSLAGQKSVRPIEQDDDDDDLNSWGRIKGQKRSNATRHSVVDPEARLMSKGGEAHLRHSMHLLTDADSGLVVGLRVDTADGRAERRNAVLMLDHARRRHLMARTGARHGRPATSRPNRTKGRPSPRRTPQSAMRRCVGAVA